MMPLSDNNSAEFPIILGIETSCDETACALMSGGRLLGERVHSQEHSAFGGVVPELASRDHLRRLLPLIADLLKEYGRRPTHIAYTRGPGLASALLTGAATANALAFSWGIPALPVNHLTGHILSPRLSREFAYPYIALLVSGGHTQLWEARGANDMRLLGGTLDDAAGEAFDKTAVLLGLGYPGGASLEELALSGDAGSYDLPSPAQPGLNFSFSGLKSAVRRLLERDGTIRGSDIAASFQEAAARGLAKQARAALLETGALRLAVVGGVAQNNAIWRCLSASCEGIDLHRPPRVHCGDNAAMIVQAAHLQLSERAGGGGGGVKQEYDFDIAPRWLEDSAA